MTRNITTATLDDGGTLFETERLRLRRFTSADADHLFALDDDPEVMRYINGGRPASREAITSETLPLFTRRDARHPALGFWAAEHKNGGEFIGWFCYRRAGETPAIIALGYRLHRATWGLGYATEGARALIDRGFSKWGVQRVVATTYEENTASRRVMEKLGMQLVRRYRPTPADLASVDTAQVDGDDAWDGDDVEYALDIKDWKKPTAGRG